MMFRRSGFLSILICATYGLNLWGQCTQYQGRCQADWMRGLSQAVKQSPITQLKLMGTHDSGAYQLALNVTPPMEATPLLDLATRFGQQSAEIEEFLRKTSLSQSLSIYAQLEQGIRALDLRLLYSRIAGDFFISHSFATVPLASVLSQIRQFMSHHTDEVLIVQMQNDFEHRAQTAPFHSQATTQIRAALSELLIPLSANQTLNDTMTLSSLVGGGRRILWSYWGMWPDAIVESFWPNGQNVSQSLTAIESYLPQLNSSRVGALSRIFFTITPTRNSIVEGLLGDAIGCPRPHGISGWARELRSPAMSFIHDNKVNLNGLNIVSVDFPTDDYVQQIIDWNSQF